MSQTPIILEFGSQSLKVHYQSQRSGVFRKARFAWDLGHEVYSTGRISEATAKTALRTIQDLRERGFQPRNLMAIATGALRDAQNRKAFLTVLEDKLGVDVRVISGQEEASLLAHGYLRSYKQLPALLTDIGGGSLEIVYLGADKTILRDSLPLGAIRMHHFGLDEIDGVPQAPLICDEAPEGHPQRHWNEGLVSGFIESSLEEASLLIAEEVFTTGGTGKAIAKTVGKTEFTADDLEVLLDDVRRKGPPPGLKPDRARVFLPGVLVLHRLLVHSNARCLRYIKIPAGRIFLERMVQRTATAANHDRKRFMLQNMRITTIHPKLSGIFPPPEAPSDKGPASDEASGASENEER